MIGIHEDGNVEEISSCSMEFHDSQGSEQWLMSMDAVHEHVHEHVVHDCS